MPSDYARIAKVLEYLSQENTASDLESLSALVDLSPGHFQRMFQRYTGITPKNFISVRNLSAAKALLSQGQSLLETRQAVGLSGTGRLHDLFVKLEAMTPGEFKQQGLGLRIRWALLTTTLGEVLLSATDRGLCGLVFWEGGDPLDTLRLRWPQAEFMEDVSGLQPYADALQAQLGGWPAPQAPLAIIAVGSAFQIKVWEALLRLPEGAVTTYAAIAQAVGQAGASRAVGTAIGANPMGVLIPCHRVIRATGALGGYRWGEARKRQLLMLEQARRLYCTVT